MKYCESPVLTDLTCLVANHYGSNIHPSSESAYRGASKFNNTITGGYGRHDDAANYHAIPGRPQVHACNISHRPWRDASSRLKSIYERRIFYFLYNNYYSILISLKRHLSSRCTRTHRALYEPRIHSCYITTSKDYPPLNLS